MLARSSLTLLALVAIVEVVGCRKEVPPPWSQLNLPASGLKEVGGDTDEHGYYAEYSGRDRDGLLAEASECLRNAGYQPACTALDGLVLGFSKDNHNVAMKVDDLGGLWLSIFDGSGKEPLLHGLCFGKYQLGSKVVVKPGEASSPFVPDPGR